MKKWLRLLKVLLSAGILFLVFRKVDFGALLMQLREVTSQIVFLGFAILLVQCGLSSLKWKIILGGEGKRVPFLYLLKCYLIGNFMSLFLPSSFGGDVYRIYALRKHNKDYFQNTASVLFDRLTGLFALASLSIMSFSLFYREMVNYYFVAAYGLAIFFFWTMSSRRGIEMIGKIGNRFVNMFLRIMESFSRYRHNKRVLLSSVLIAFLFQSNIVLLNKIYCFAVGIDAGLAFLFMVIPLIYLTEALPISINGLGVREGAFVFFFMQGGFSREQAVAVALLVIAMRYTFSLGLGGSLFLRQLLKGDVDNRKTAVPG